MHISVFCGAIFSAALSKVHWTFFTPAQRTNHRGRAAARPRHRPRRPHAALRRQQSGTDGRHERRGPAGKRPRGGSHPHLLQRRHHPLAARQRARPRPHPRGWIDCYPKSRHAGTLFCGGVTMPRDIAGNHKLQAAYELGKNIQ